MAVVRFNTAFDQGSLYVFTGDVTLANATTIAIENGLDRVVYAGQFTYDSEGNVGGTLQSANVVLNNQPMFNATGLNFPASVFSNFIDNGNIEELFQQILSGADTFYGSEGTDAIHTYGSADHIEAGSGADYIYSGDGADSIFAGLGDDNVDAGAGDDLIFGGQGDGRDLINAGAGNDQVYAGDGNDRVYGYNGADTIGGGLGADELNGGDGNDQIFGGGGDYVDVIDGGLGNDRMFAGGGNDAVSGGEGDDEVGAGAGADVVSGGTGNDIIYLGVRDGATDLYKSVANNGSDTVYGFENGIDHLDLRASGFTSFAQVQARLGSAPDGDATITLAAGQVVTLDGIAIGQIDATDFVF